MTGGSNSNSDSFANDFCRRRRRRRRRPRSCRRSSSNAIVVPMVLPNNSLLGRMVTTSTFYAFASVLAVAVFLDLLVVVERNEHAVAWSSCHAQQQYDEATTTTTTTAAAAAAAAAAAPSKDRRLIDLLFPDGSLQNAWEIHPLLATAAHRRRRRSDASCLAPDASPSCSSDPDGPPIVPTVYYSDGDDDGAVDDESSSSSSRRSRLEFLQRLFTLDDMDALLSQPGLFLSSNDFTLTKTTYIQSGHDDSSGDAKETEVAETLTNQQVRTSSNIRNAVHENGFSLVVNSMQRRWDKICNFTRTILNEVKCHHINANLYLTPEPELSSPSLESSSSASGDDGIRRRRGFGLHWDYMDNVIVQLSGSKLWSVATYPTVYMSSGGMERSPTPEEQTKYNGPGGRYRDVLLRPGDVLYIPPGFMHNTSTVSSDDEYFLLDDDGGLQGGDGEEDGRKDDSFDAGPSLHLTLGLEYGCETTFEALIHHAVTDLFFRGRPDLFEVAIPKKECKGSSYKIWWSTVLHYYVAAVSHHGGGGSNDNGRGNGEECEPETGDACALLRRSVSLYQGSVEEAYRKAVRAVTDVSSSHNDDHDPVTVLIDFVTQIQTVPALAMTFCFPAMLPWDTLTCPGALDTPSIRDTLPTILDAFREFASENYEGARKLMDEHLDKWWDNLVERDDGFVEAAMEGRYHFG